MMWKKWGTPPATAGPYTSGFEEEFERSFKRLETNNTPEMAIYFKEIDSDLLNDPGKDLQKVLNLKERIISEKKILYDTFKEIAEFQKCVRLKITDYLTKLDQSKHIEVTERQTPKFSQTTEESDSLKSPFSKEGHIFLKKLIEKAISKDFELTPYEIARMRLLSFAVSKPGNDNTGIGVHDANLVFLNNDANLGLHEILCLIDSGLKNIDHENIPFWRWSSEYAKHEGESFLAFRSVSFSNETLSIGALKLMTLIGSPAESIKYEISRETIIKLWLGKEVPNNTRIAALNYLKKYGKLEDLPLISSEINKADSVTFIPALETLLCINCQHNKELALKIAIEKQFHLIDLEILEELLSVISNIESETLKAGLQHGNENIRFESFLVLKKRNQIDSSELNKLKLDPSALIRKEVVNFLLLQNDNLDYESIKKILVKPSDETALGLLAKQTNDTIGSILYQ